ncbi:MAG: DNA modification methylase [Spirochaeta sp. LUC14_002_19_P3]|nr:MAG: DNA modification methylase [Spirochaeta sp. LUC14_002_19_P3]
MPVEAGENPRFLKEQLITCLGNKRGLLGFIEQAVNKVAKRLGRNKLCLFDAFSGSGAVSRCLKQYASRLITNDMEPYAAIANHCYLSNPSEIPLTRLKEIHQDIIRTLENSPLKEGFITELYAPKDDKNIATGERVFYTRRNALFIDSARQIISTLPPELQNYFTAPLLSEASIHANTAGVFKGFYKDKNGIGKFGGQRANALQRILGGITLPFPVFSNFECEHQVYQQDSNTLAPTLKGLDITYIDPPYNQHPYGSNYFMLNLIASYRCPKTISPVSGIPQNWNKSPYNKRNQAAAALETLITSLDTRFLLISYNAEGFITPSQMTRILSPLGTLEIMKADYTVFRGSRNLKQRPIQVKEYLYLVEKK